MREVLLFQGSILMSIFQRNWSALGKKRWKGPPPLFWYGKIHKWRPFFSTNCIDFDKKSNLKHQQPFNLHPLIWGIGVCFKTLEKFQVLETCFFLLVETQKKSGFPEADFIQGQNPREYQLPSSKSLLMAQIKRLQDFFDSF